MNSIDRAISAAIGAALVAGLAATPAFAQGKGDFEKCAGIVKAGKNDCGTSATSCAGSIKTDRHAEAWILVPKGTCERIAGGRLQTSADAKHGGKG
ncbi:MAG: DUF2282 domain-containing protein [Burkholderiales bacterium]|jgi:uncharacterized membrane protein|nr:DUF2282 domain-containing protein [Burkholderiales bacterium]